MLRHPEAPITPALGVPGQYMHPSCLDAIEQVADAAKSAGITWGILPRSAEHARFCHQRGCLLFAFAGDLGIVHQGFAATRATYREFYDD